MPNDASYLPGNPALAESGLAVVLTGCSGGGKSTLLAELAARGCPVRHEAGRQIVREQLQIGGAALPWVDPEAFVGLAASRTMHLFNSAIIVAMPVFFDRSLVDLTSFLALKGIAVPEHLRRAVNIYRYAPEVFVVPPWPEIYVRDDERPKPFDEALLEYEALVKGYEAAGYRLVEVPKRPVVERADFVLDRVAARPGCG